MRQDRTEEAATALLTTDVTARQRVAITAICTDMHRPYLNAVGQTLPDAEIVFDKFHVLRWQRLPEMERLGDFLFRHIEGIAAYCDHPVRLAEICCSPYC